MIKEAQLAAVRRAVEPLAEAGAVARTQITDLEVGYPHAMRPSGSGLLVALSAFDRIDGIVPRA